MQPGRYDRRFEKARGRSNRYKLGTNCAQKVVHRLQRSRHIGRLRDSRRNEFGTLLSMKEKKKFFCPNRIVLTYLVLLLSFENYYE
jgi:hypothetical protein